MTERNDAMIGVVTQLSAISKEGMASTEEVASLAGNLADLADKLKQSTNMFRI
jgi:methyl-accepting chemotaxis protein